MVKLTGNELYKLYEANDTKEYIFLYDRRKKGSFHPLFEVYLAIRATERSSRIEWFVVSNINTYDWIEMNEIEPNCGRTMIKAIFEKDLDPSFEELS